MTSQFFIGLCIILCVTHYIGATKADPADLQCGENERVDDCPDDFCDNCPKSEIEAKGCPMAKMCPVYTCKCIFDYSRAENGTCIPTRLCPPFDCSARPHERFDPCPPLCHDDCKHATPSGDCPQTLGFIGTVRRCTPACTCLEHYWRKNGICVPYSQCHTDNKKINTYREICQHCPKGFLCPKNCF